MDILKFTYLPDPVFPDKSLFVYPCIQSNTLIIRIAGYYWCQNGEASFGGFPVVSHGNNIHSTKLKKYISEGPANVLGFPVRTGKVLAETFFALIHAPPGDLYGFGIFRDQV